jgi:PKHD-type hydroxylase
MDHGATIPLMQPVNAMTMFKSKPQNVSGPIVVWKDLFSPKELDAIEAYGDSLMPERAGVVGGDSITDHARITRIAWILHKPEMEWLFAKLEKAVLEINAQFYSFDLFGLEQAFQYTVYDGAEGGHYDWHVDLGGHDTEFRKISLSLQLTEPTRYEGCDLTLQAGSGPFSAERARGTLIAFPSYVLHRVTPIQSGLRKSLVIWVAGPPFR